MTTKVSARERLLAAADELFYAEGVQSVGIDRVIERAGVAKASLYNSFRSKDELVSAYLGRRGESILSRLWAKVALYTDPRDRLLAVFEAQAEGMARTGYHGCAFASASAEAKQGSPVDTQVCAYRGHVRDAFTKLATEAGVHNPIGLATQLQQIYDGAAQSVRLDRNREAACQGGEGDSGSSD